jgi:hypothetical protein
MGWHLLIPCYLAHMWTEKLKPHTASLPLSQFTMLRIHAVRELVHQNNKGRLIMHIQHQLWLTRAGTRQLRGINCNISLLRTPNWTYYLRTLACKWSSSLYDWLFWLWLWDVEDLMICYLVIFISTCVIDWFSWVCRTLDVWGCWWHRWISLDSRSSQGVDYYGLNIFDITYVTYD